MTHPTNIHPVTAVAAQPTEVAPAGNWSAKVGELLAQAAALCVEHDIELEAWMRGAWSAYVEARPGYREFLEETQLKQQLQELRDAGRIGRA